MSSVDQLQDALDSMGLTSIESSRAGGAGGEDPSPFYYPWNLEPPLDSTLSLSPGRGDFDSGLDRSLNSDKFGLNSSTASSGFGALDDLVSKILEDDQSLFGSYNGLGDSSHDRRNGASHDMFNYDG